MATPAPHSIDAPHTRSPSVSTAPSAAIIAQTNASDAPTSASLADSFVACSPLVRVDAAKQLVELDCMAVLETGFLEQYICLAGTRDHEALFVFEGRASEVHAAMLLAGFISQAPGAWQEVASESEAGAMQLKAIAPRGSELEIEVRLADGTSHPLEWFVRAAPIGTPTSNTPPRRFIFGGSKFHRDRRTGVERYVADGSGSLVGLVTFGDETIGALEVIPDSASAAQPMWEVWSERMPPMGSRVQVRITGLPK